MTSMRKKGYSRQETEDLGRCPNPLRKLLKKFSKDFQNFNPIGFWVLFLRCANFGVAVCRVAISGCSEPNPVERNLGAYALYATG